MSWYQWLSVLIAVLSLFGVGTVFSMFWRDRHDKKQQNSEKAHQQQKEERKQEIREVLEEGMSLLENKVDILGIKIDQINAGTLSTLRNDILDEYYKCSDKGYRNDYDYQNFMKLYNAYHDLGGNCFIEDVKERFEKLPSKEGFRAKTSVSPVPVIKKSTTKNKDTHLKEV